MRLSFFLLLVFIQMSKPSWALSLSPSTEISYQANFDVSRLHYNHKTETFDSVITIQNKSTKDIEEPFTLTFPSLPQGVTLINRTSISDEGIPFITINDRGAIYPKEEIEVALKFVNKTKQPFSIDFRFIRLDQKNPNLERILGTDKNNNGVRDDLEPLVDIRYSSFGMRRAAMHVLKNMRDTLAVGSVESAFAAALSLNKAFACIYSTLGNDDLAAQEVDYLHNIMVDTKERVHAWIQSNKLLAGQSLPVDFNNPCKN